VRAAPSCRAQSLYCAISLAKRRNALGPAKRRNKTIAPYGIGGKADENLKAGMK
jgi:hypothetical protein